MPRAPFRSPGSPASLALALLLLGGCNRYDLFRETGYQQQSYSNKADILFVIDNSDSMIEEATALSENFGTFIRNLTQQEDAIQSDGLADAVNNYVNFVQDRGAFVDYQFGVTTTDATETNGLLLGKTPIVAKGDPELEEHFIENLACNATCFPDEASAGSDANYQCGDPFTQISSQYLDCVCNGSWVGANCGAADEMGLDAVFKAMCRSVPNPPVDCFDDDANDDGEVDDDYFPLDPDKDTLSNDGFLRDNSTLIVVVVTDEGDGSPRMQSSEVAPYVYEQLYGTFGKGMAWAAIDPPLKPDYSDLLCPSPGAAWGVLRYDYFVNKTGGVRYDITNDNCQTGDFATALEDLGNLLRSLFNSFPLQSVPQPDTIRVYVNGDEVAESSVVSQDAEYGIVNYSTGWSYSADTNAVLFHGDAIPTYDAQVQVFYKPVDGMPRELPF